MRTIRSDQLRVGMFVHALTGSWLSHPFWRSRFLLTDRETLDTLHAYGRPVVIDEARGAALAPAGATPPPAAPPPAVRRPEPVSFAQERRGFAQRAIEADLAAARKVVGESKVAMKRLFNDVRLGKAISAASVTGLVEEISRSVEHNAQALIGVVRLKNKDEYTYLHSVAVCALMINFARHLGCREPEVQLLGMAGMLHDVGKMAVPATVLNKPGRLTDDEFATVRDHPRRGHEILSGGEGVPAEALDVCLHHHERPDGRGYPFRLQGEAISRHARMGAICDVYDALTSTRTYKAAWTPSQAATAMWRWDGQFDRALLFQFFRSIGIFPVGIVVRLRSNRLAIVLDNGRRGSRQRARAFYALADDCLIAPEDVELGETLADDQAIALGEAEALRIDDWDAVRARLAPAAEFAELD